MTLLLGPPGSGKSTLLKALSGKLSHAGLRIGGNVTYNSKTLSEFVPQRTAAYIEQVDVHIAELTCACLPHCTLLMRSYNHLCSTSLAARSPASSTV